MPAGYGHHLDPTAVRAVDGRHDASSGAPSCSTISVLDHADPELGRRATCSNRVTPSSADVEGRGRTPPAAGPGGRRGHRASLDRIGHASAMTTEWDAAVAAVRAGADRRGGRRARAR